MGEMIGVEILNRHGGVIARQRCAGDTLRIGRGYDNDVVIDDPFVAAAHLRVARGEDGRLVAEDLGSANGTYLGHGRERVQRRVIGGDDILRIGHSYLRLREASHAVAPERTAEGSARAYLVTAGVGAAAFGLETLILWLNQTTQPHFSSYATGLLALAGVTLVWVAIWALLCRIFSGHARFQRHLRFAFAGLLAYAALRMVASWIAFALPWPTLVSYEYIGTWCLLAAIGFFSLREISPFRLRLKGGVIAGLAALAIALQSFGRSESDFAVTQRDYAWVLMPPSLRLFAPHREDAFFANVEALKAKLDRDRVEAEKED
jgi:pSer/pThr/pTyr-binding forkhead associated (FHA) protein